MKELYFIRPYLRGLPLIILCMVVAYTFAAQYLKYVVPKYESTAKIRLADMGEGVPNSNLFKDLDVFATTQKLNAEIEIIKSDLIIEKALSKLLFTTTISRVGELKKQELYKDSPILIEILKVNEDKNNKSYPFRIKNEKEGSFVLANQKEQAFLLGDTLNVDGHELVITLNTAFLSANDYIQIADNYELKLWSKEALIAEIKKNLDVSLVDKDVPVVRISYTSAHPGKAFEFPNLLAKTYIEDYIESKYEAANTTVEFLQDRISETSKELSKSERDILNYRESNSITNIRQETETDLRKLAQLKIQLTNINMSLEAMEELERYILAGQDNFLELAPNFEAFTDLLSTEIIKKIKALQAEKKDLLIHYTAKDEKVKVVDEKIKDLTSYLTESIQNTRRNLAIKRDKLELNILEEEKKFVSIPEKERNMTILNREFENIQRSYNFLTQKKIEAEIAKAAKIAFHRVIEEAKIEKTPISPNKGIIKIVSAILGMFGAILFIMIVHAFKAKVNNIHNIEKSTDIPVEAFVRKHKTQNEKQKFFSELVNKWEVKGLLVKNGIIAFNSFRLREGSRYMLEQILPILEKQNKRVLVIDFTHQLKVNPALEIMRFTVNELDFLSANDLKKDIRKIALNYDYTLILNETIETPHAFSVMALTDVNVFSVDSRLTPLNKIESLNDIETEYNFNKNVLAFNRYQYNPSLFVEAKKMIGKLTDKLKGLKR